MTRRRGHSDAPLVAKLGVKAAQRLALIGAPAGWLAVELPEGVEVVHQSGRRGADVAVPFFDCLSEIEPALPDLTEAIVTDGALWLAWPRRRGRIPQRHHRSTAAGLVLPSGLVDVKGAALGANLSGLKFVWRKELRAARRAGDKPAG